VACTPLSTWGKADCKPRKKPLEVALAIPSNPSKTATPKQEGFSCLPPILPEVEGQIGKVSTTPMEEEQMTTSERQEEWSCLQSLAGRRISCRT